MKFWYDKNTMSDICLSHLYPWTNCSLHCPGDLQEIFVTLSPDGISQTAESSPLIGPGPRDTVLWLVDTLLCLCCYGMISGSSCTEIMPWKHYERQKMGAFCLLWAVPATSASSCWGVFNSVELTWLKLITLSGAVFITWLSGPLTSSLHCGGKTFWRKIKIPSWRRPSPFYIY